MSSAVQFYIATDLVLFGVDLIACWALNLQLRTGVLNFAFIIFQAAGAYTAAILTLGPSSAHGNIQSYIGGMTLPFPLPWVAACACGAAIAVPLGLIVLPRLRGSYEALAFLVMSLIATQLAEALQGVANGPTGLALIPQPLAGVVHLSPLAYTWFYVGLTGAVCVGVYWFVARVTGSPLGRKLRAIHDNEAAAEALGKNVTWARLTVFVAGGALAALSGAVLVGFIGAWSPSSWRYPETFVLATAVIVGGWGNNLGVLIGTAAVPVGFFEITRFFPTFGPPGFIDAVQWMAIGLLILLFLWFRPDGILPEGRHRWRRGRPASAAAPGAPG
ncbi:MAG TPA: branched-chain amino acid ABC transporter permease [Candidatus Micrarchaeia archaeon]|nr:branched-chain amino acid ABC transporter permease [Candidatus Micrarchaeia archaeon]